MIVKGLPEGLPWAHSLKDHLRRNMEVNKWFQPENFVQFRNSPLLAAISTLFPDQYVAGDAIQLAIKSLNLTIGPDSYLTDVLLSHLPTDRILRTIKKRIQRSPSKKVFNKILIPINVKSTHWYLGVLQRQQAGECHLQTHNNCISLINEQAENNLRAVGDVLSGLSRQSGEIDTPTKYQHQRHPNFLDVRGNSEVPVQDGRTRQSTNRKSQCPPMEITNSLDNEKSESQHSSQPLDQVNYGTPPDEMVRSFEDYNWELGRMIRYRRNDKGGTDRL